MSKECFYDKLSVRVFVVTQPVENAFTRSELAYGGAVNRPRLPTNFFFFRQK